MRSAVRDGRGKLEKVIKAAAKAIIREAATDGNGPAAKRRGLAKSGIEAQGLIQDEITSLSSPPNSPVTIALKGSSKPLIDSGEMCQAVTFKIED